MIQLREYGFIDPTFGPIFEGKYGAKGRVNESVFSELYQHSIAHRDGNYFTAPFPKSLDINQLSLVPGLETLSLEDACRTLEAFTADTIVTGLASVQGLKPQLLVLAGGGWNNPVITQELEARARHRLNASISVGSVQKIGWNNQAMEAQIFAYLAVRSLLGEPISIPETTGVPKPLTGGSISIPSTGATENVRQTVVGT